MDCQVVTSVTMITRPVEGVVAVMTIQAQEATVTTTRLVEAMGTITDTMDTALTTGPIMGMAKHMTMDVSRHTTTGMAMATAIGTSLGMTIGMCMTTDT